MMNIETNGACKDTKELLSSTHFPFSLIIVSLHTSNYVTILYRKL